jgi:hypothetical protein
MGVAGKFVTSSCLSLLLVVVRVGNLKENQGNFLQEFAKLDEFLRVLMSF